MKTKNDMRRARWEFVRMWGLFFLLLLIWGLACDGTGGDVRRPEPQKPKCEYRYDFSANPEGSFPSDWWAFGTDKVQPKVITKDGNKGLLFNSADGPAGDKFVIAATPDSRTNCQAAYVMAKITVHNNKDFAGLVTCYLGEDAYFRVGLNVFQDEVRLEEKVGGRDRQPSITKTYPLNVNQAYWLKVVFDYNTKTASVYASPDGSNFAFVASLTNLREIKGKFGLTTFGPNHPEVLFDDFVVIGEGTAPVVVPPTPTPKKEMPKLTVVKSVEIGTQNIWVGEPVKARMTVRNDGTEPAELSCLLIAGRGPDGKEDYQDFLEVNDLVIQPGQTYDYKAERAFSKVGSYRFFAQCLAGKAHRQTGVNAWFTVPAGENQTNHTEAYVRLSFKERFGYDLLEQDYRWTVQEVTWLEETLIALKNDRETFYRLGSLTSFVKCIKTEHEGGAEYLPDKKIIQVTWQAAYDGWPSNAVIGHICHPYDSVEQKFKGYIVHELTHALQSCDPNTKEWVDYTKNQFLIDYAIVAKWKSGEEYAGELEDLPGYTLLRWSLGCLESAKWVAEDMAEAARLYVTRPQELTSQARIDFVRERIFAGKTY